MDISIWISVKSEGLAGVLFLWKLIRGMEKWEVERKGSAGYNYFSKNASLSSEK